MCLAIRYNRRGWAKWQEKLLTVCFPTSQHPWSFSKFFSKHPHALDSWYVTDVEYCYISLENSNSPLVSCDTAEHSLGTVDPDSITYELNIHNFQLNFYLCTISFLKWSSWQSVQGPRGLQIEVLRCAYQLHVIDLYLQPELGELLSYVGTIVIFCFTTLSAINSQPNYSHHWRLAVF